MVVQFVAFLGAWRHPDGLKPWVAAVFASPLVAWVTFVLWTRGVWGGFSVDRTWDAVTTGNGSSTAHS